MRSVSLDGLTFCLLVIFVLMLVIFHHELAPAADSLISLLGQIVDHIVELLQKIARAVR